MTTIDNEDTPAPPYTGSSAPSTNGNGAKPPPHDPLAERALVAHLLVYTSHGPEAAQLCPPEAIYTTAYRALFTAILASGNDADPTVVASHLDPRHAAELGSLADLQLEGTATWRPHARRIALLAHHRSLAAQAEALRLATYGEDTDAITAVLAALAQSRSPDQANDSWQPIDLVAVAHGEHLTQPPTILARADGQPLIYPGKLHAFNAESETGKAQPLDTSVLVPGGWRRIGDLIPGDLVMGANGRPTTVVAVHERGEREVCRITFSDGASTECCTDHLWLVRDLNHVHRDQPGRVIPTLQLRDELLTGRRRYLPIVAPIDHPERRLAIDPYLLGLLLGDGGLTKNITFTSGDPELIESVRQIVGPVAHLHPSTSNPMTVSISTKRGRPNPYRDELARLGLMGHKSEHKWVPPEYLYASIDQRMSILQGLLDTDGSVEKRSVRFCSTSERLIEGVTELVESLGGVATRTSKYPTYVHNGQRREGRKAYLLSIKLPIWLGAPFRLERKVSAWRALDDRRRKIPCRRIVSVDLIGRKPVRCITVDAPDHLYVTERHIVTHNSWLGLAATLEQTKLGHTCLYLDFEDGANGTAERLVDLGATDDDLSRVIYVRPDDPANPQTIARIIATPPILAVIDGVTELMVLHGWEANSGDDIAKMMGTICRPLTRAGIATILIDHVVKNRQEQGNYATGSQHKRAGIDGATYKLEAITPFGRGLVGRARLTITKDRPGHIRPACNNGKHVGTLVLDSTGDGAVLTITTPEKSNIDGQGFRPTTLMERVSRAVQTANAAGLYPTTNEIFRDVSGQRNGVIQAVVVLIAEGYLVAEDGPNRSRRHTSLRPYVAPSDRDQPSPNEPENYTESERKTYPDDF